MQLVHLQTEPFHNQLNREHGRRGKKMVSMTLLSFSIWFPVTISVWPRQQAWSYLKKFSILMIIYCYTQWPGDKFTPIGRMKHRLRVPVFNVSFQKIQVITTMQILYHAYIKQISETKSPTTSAFIAATEWSIWPNPFGKDNLDSCIRYPKVEKWKPGKKILQHN